MSRKVTINITQEVIDRAIERMKECEYVPSVCPIATALQEQIGGVVTVGFLIASIDGKTVYLPPEAQAITILKSREWANVKPQSFEIYLEDSNEAAESV